MTTQTEDLISDVQAVVFDLYGTLCDVHSVVHRCDASYPGRGAEISAMWRQKQLDPRVYTLAFQALGLSPAHILFVLSNASNASNASGAGHFGFDVCRVIRHDNMFDELGTVPTSVVCGWDEVPEVVRSTSP